MNHAILLAALAFVLVAAGCGGGSSVTHLPDLPTGMSRDANGDLVIEEDAAFSSDPIEMTYRYPIEGERWYRHEEVTESVDDSQFVYCRSRSGVEQRGVTDRLIEVVVEDWDTFGPVSEGYWFAKTTSSEEYFMSDQLWWRMGFWSTGHRMVIAAMPAVFRSGDRWSATEIGPRVSMQVDVDVLDVQARSPNGYDGCIHLRVVEAVSSHGDSDVLDSRATHDRYLLSDVGMVYEEKEVAWSDGTAAQWHTVLIDQPDIVTIEEPTIEYPQPHLPSGVREYIGYHLDSTDSFSIEPEGANYQLPLGGVFWYHVTRSNELEDGRQVRQSLRYERYEYRTVSRSITGADGFTPFSVPCIAASVERYRLDPDEGLALISSDEVFYLASDGFWWEFEVADRSFQWIARFWPVHMQEGDSWSTSRLNESKYYTVLAENSTAPDGTTDCFKVARVDRWWFILWDRPSALTERNPSYMELFVADGIGTVSETSVQFLEGQRHEGYDVRLVDPPVESTSAGDG